LSRKNGSEGGKRRDTPRHRSPSTGGSAATLCGVKKRALPTREGPAFRLPAEGKKSYKMQLGGRKARLNNHLKSQLFRRKKKKENRQRKTRKFFAGDANWQRGGKGGKIPFPLRQHREVSRLEKKKAGEHIPLTALASLSPGVWIAKGELSFFSVSY